MLFLLAVSADAAEFAVQDSDLAFQQPAATAVSAQVLEVRLINQVLPRPNWNLQDARLVVRSTTDERYRDGVAIPDYGYWVRPARYTLRKDLRLKHTYFTLFLPQPLRPGGEYTVELAHLTFRALDRQTGGWVKEADGPAPALTLKFAGDAARSRAVHVNQVGYEPAATKLAYLTAFAGYRQGEPEQPLDVDFAGARRFLVVDAATGERRYEGTPKLSPRCLTPEDGSKPDALSQSRVWDLDFSEFRTPGRYRVVVPGVGSSYPFAIAPAAYNQVLGVLMRGAYQQRCGTALTPEFTRFPHPACHLDDARVPATTEYKHEELEFYPQAEGTTLACSGGHHDAGDYGKYVTSGARFAFHLLLPFEAAPAQVAYDQSPLPEAGNGIPDLLDEAAWELKWLSAMQDPADGAVHIICKPHATMSYEDGLPGLPSEKFKGPRVLWWKDIQATAAYAAILARAARTPAFRQHFPKEADAYLARALKAWEFCQKQTSKDGKPAPLVGGHHYGSFLQAQDEYCWAAVELWLTTGEARFHDYYLKFHKVSDSWLWKWWPLHEACGAATRAYVFGPRAGKDPAMLTACRENGLLAAARSTRGWQDAWATRVSFAQEPYKFGKWGWFFLADMASTDQLLAALLAPPDEARGLREAALFNADQECGNSADDLVSITGLGRKRQVDIVHQHAWHDGIVEPVPGIPLGFHPCGIAMAREIEIPNAYLVTALPPAYRNADGFNIQQEFTVSTLGPTIAAYALLGQPAAQRGGRPTLTITANGQAQTLTGTAPLRVEFAAVAAGVNGKTIREVYWDLDTEDVAVDERFAYTFATPGQYRVACTATDDCGWATWQVVRVNVAQPAAQLPNAGEPFAATPDTIGLWHLDGDVANAAGELKLALTGQAAFSADNLLWRRAATGQALHLDGPDDGVLIKLPDDVFSNPKITRVEVEALVAWQDDIPRGRGHSRMFLLFSNWDTQLGLYRDMWNGKLLQGVGGEAVKDEAFRRQWQQAAVPRPGWQRVALGFDRATGQAWLACGEQRVAFLYRFGPAQQPTQIHLGGFRGYLDEVRLRLTRKAD